ncbi:MAG: hypothetical protein ACW98Y_17455 [Candidatus Thorarchaeota archaeon]
MAFDEGPTFEQAPQGGAHFRVSWTGLVSRTFSLWGRKLVPYMLIASLPIIINVAIQITVLWMIYDVLSLALIGSFGTDPFSILLTLFTSTAEPLYLIVTIPLMFVGIVVSAIVSGAVIKLALDNYGAPEMGDWRESMSFAFGRIVKIILVQLVISFILIACMIPGLIIMIQAAYTFDFMLILYGVVIMYIGIPLALYLITRFAPASAVVIAEDHSVIDTLKRAYALSSGQFWHIFAGTILLGIVVGLIGGIVGIATAPAYIFALSSPLTGLLLLAAITGLTTIITSPISSIFYAVLYRDLVERDEKVVEIW